jgi:SAM-dependent methyltransferase
MSISFGQDYSEYYDLFYKDKEYEKEIVFVLENLIEHGSNVFSSSTLVDLGCGSGRYLAELTTNFKTLVGIDISPDMISKASKIMKDCKNVTFMVRDIGAKNKFEINADYVFSLFHVFSYMTSKDQQLNFLKNLAVLINQNKGIGFFDFWNRKAWELDPPITRTRSIDLPQGKLIRTSQPSVDMNQGLCRVQMDFEFIDEKSAESRVGETEIHEMKAYRSEDIVDLCKEAGLEIVNIGPWMSRKQDWNFSDWYGYCIVKIAE